MEDINKLMKELLDIKGDALRLPLPRRIELEPVQKILSVMWGPYWNIACELAKKELQSGEMISQLHNLPGFEAHFKKIGNKGSLISNIISMRHTMAKAPIFTVSDALSKMLDDTVIGKDIPAKFFVAPFKTCYIEFNPSERREDANLELVATGIPSKCEGSFIQENSYDVLPRMDRHTIEALELDTKKPVRILDIGFSASPFNNPNLKNDIPIAMDAMDFATIYIQDEDESINDLLHRHYNYYSNRNVGERYISTDHEDAFKKQFEMSFSALSRVLFYLHVESRDIRKETPKADLENKIRGVSEKKKDKLKRQLNRTYDRIVIGPREYTPIDERISATQFKGKVRPHYRRATIGVRWVGTGKEKRPELRRIKESVVNSHLLKGDEERRDYLIR